MAESPSTSSTAGSGTGTGTDTGVELLTRRDSEKRWNKATGEQHVFQIRGRIAHWLELEDVLFHHDSAVMMPDRLDGTDEQDQITGLDVIAAGLTHARDNAAQKLLITGHTDTSGGVAYNVSLSEMRGDSAMAALVGDRDTWASVAQGKHKVEDYQQILTWIAQTRGWPCDPGGVDNNHGTGTSNAIIAFKEQYKSASFGTDIGSSGSVDLATWKAFFTMYMERLKEILQTDDAGLEQLRAALTWLDGAQRRVGCGEHHPVEQPGRDGFRSQANRRVELIFFDPDEEPRLDCHAGGTCQPDLCELYDGETFDFRHITPTPGPRPGGVTNLKWTPTTAVCGDTAKITADTTAADGTAMTITLTRTSGSGPALQSLNTTVSGGKIDVDWQVKNVGFEQGGAFLDAVDVQAQVGSGGATAMLRVEALLDAAKEDFDETRSWSGFSMSPHFEQRIERFLDKVDVAFDVLKAWGGYYINLTTAGITGTAGGCPWAGFRWGRAIGANPMAPNQYHDGNNWVPLPVGFVLTGTNHSAIGFYQSGANFVSTSGGTWPGSFAPYDFNSATYTQRRADWIADTHTTWTDVFHIRRKNCPSDTPVRCCRYGMDVTLAFTQVTTHSSGVISLCPGQLRSNASIWFMDEPRIKVAAHESGHHMDNPDEYAGGAVDPTVNGDGAVNGIDADSIMGANLTVVKKRHYHAFAAMNKRLADTAYSKTYDYEVVDK